MPIGRDLAAKDIQQGAGLGIAFQLQHIFAGGFLRLGSAVVEQRAHTGIAPHDLVAGDGETEIFAGRGAEIVFFVLADRHRGRIAGIIAVGGADQGEVILVGNGENDPAVAILENIAAVMAVEPPHHNMAALDQADMVARRFVRNAIENLIDPGPGGIDHQAGTHLAHLAGDVHP